MLPSRCRILGLVLILRGALSEDVVVGRQLAEFHVHLWLQLGRVGLGDGMLCERVARGDARGAAGGDVRWRARGSRRPNGVRMGVSCPSVRRERDATRAARRPRSLGRKSVGGLRTLVIRRPSGAGCGVRVDLRGARERRDWHWGQWARRAGASHGHVHRDRGSTGPPGHGQRDIDARIRVFLYRGSKVVVGSDGGGRVEWPVGIAAEARPHQDGRWWAGGATGQVADPWIIIASERSSERTASVEMRTSGTS